MSACPEGYSDERSGRGWLIHCPNMRGVENDRDMEYEHYECKVCGLRTKLDYDEMR